MALKSAPTKSATKPAAVKSPAKILAGTVKPSADDVHRKKTLVLYENALKLMQTGKYQKAHDVFNEMLLTAPHELGDRIRMYIAACVAQLHQGKTEFVTHEERYDYAISLLNHGHYEDAREHFQAILLKEKSADYAFYGLALLASMTGETQKCIDHLTEAIRLNARYRLQARGDADFADVADDPSFTELLYPEA